MSRTVLLDANVIDPINRGNEAAAKRFELLLKSNATVYISAQASRST